MTVKNNDQQKTTSILDETDPFDRLSTSDLRTILNRGQIVKVEKNNTVFCEGEQAHSVFVLIEGKIQLTKTSYNGRDIVVRLMDKPALFAEVVLFGDQVYPVTAMAVSRTTVLELPCGVVQDCLSFPAFRDALIQHLMTKHVYLTERLLYYMCSDVEERFFQFLKTRYPDQQNITLDISKKDLAAAIGTVPETLSRLLRRLENEGLLSIDKKTLVIKPGLEK